MTAYVNGMHGCYDHDRRRNLNGPRRLIRPLATMDLVNAGTVAFRRHKQHNLTQKRMLDGAVGSALGAWENFLGNTVVHRMNLQNVLKAHLDSQVLLNDLKSGSTPRLGYPGLVSAHCTKLSWTHTYRDRRGIQEIRSDEYGILKSAMTDSIMPTSNVPVILWHDDQTRNTKESEVELYKLSSEVSFGQSGSDIRASRLLT